MLQREGIIERKIGSGTYLSESAPQLIELNDASVDVSPPHIRSFRETLEARLLIEPSIAAKAAELCTPERSRQLLAAADQVLQATNWLAFKEAIYAFSRVYYQHADNTFLLATYDQILQTRRASKFDGKQEQAPVARLVKQHMYSRLVAIAEAIASGDPSKAEECVREYLLGLSVSSAV